MPPQLIFPYLFSGLNLFTTLSCATGSEFPGSVLGRNDAGNLLLLADLDPPANLNLKRPWYYATVSSVPEYSVAIKQKSRICSSFQRKWTRDKNKSDTDSCRFEQGCSYFRLSYSLLSHLIFSQIQNYAVQGDEIQLSIATEQPERYEVKIDPAQAPTRLNTGLSSAVMYLTLIRECFSYETFLKKNLEDISPFCGATDTLVLDFW